MSSNIKKYYEEYEQFFEQKKIFNSNRIPGKQLNDISNQFNNSCRKVDKNKKKTIPITYAKNKYNGVNSINLEDEINMLEKNSFNFKKKKLYIPLKIYTKGEKLFYKNDGRPEKFILLDENELGINKFDGKVKILQSEEDYDSDDMVVMDGVKKAQEDLCEAIEICKKDNFKEINNFQKYYK